MTFLTRNEYAFLRLQNYERPTKTVSEAKHFTVRTKQVDSALWQQDSIFKDNFIS